MDICSSITITPLEQKDSMRFDATDELVMNTTGNLFIVLNKRYNSLLVYGGNGGYITSITPHQEVLDFCVFQDTYLDILITNGVIEYSLGDFTELHRFSFPDCTIELSSLDRRDNNVIVLAGFFKQIAYDCEYFINENTFIVMENPVCQASDYYKSRFFHKKDSTFFYYSTTGEITYYTSNDFICPVYRWNFRGRKYQIDSSVSGGIPAGRFTNVQKAEDKIYLQFRLKEEDYILIYDLSDGAYRVVHQTQEGVFFPIGVIRNNENYYCCHSAFLSNYVVSELLDNDNQVNYSDCIANNNELVIIRYSLK